MSDSCSSTNCTGCSLISCTPGERLAHKSLWRGHLFDVISQACPFPCPHFLSFPFFLFLFNLTKGNNHSCMPSLIPCSSLCISSSLAQLPDFSTSHLIKCQLPVSAPSVACFTHGLQSHLQIYRTSGSKPFCLPHLVGGEAKQTICPNSGLWQYFTLQ